MALDLTIVIQFLALLGVANGTPVVMKKLMGETMSWPLDFGRLFLDGRPVFGKSKTIRGIVSSVIMTSLAAYLIGFPLRFGAFVAVAAMGGDLISSFTKRRLGMVTSSMALGLDQIPESLLPAIVCRAIAPLTTLDIVAITCLFLVGELLLSRVLYVLKLRDQPY